MAHLIETDSFHRRCDLTSTLTIFGGLLIASTAFFTMEATSSNTVLSGNEVKVAFEQPTLTAHDVDLVAGQCLSGTELAPTNKGISASGIQPVSLRSRAFGQRQSNCRTEN